MHGFWRTLLNYNPHTQSAEHGQDLAAQAQRLLVGSKKGKEREVHTEEEVHESNTISDDCDLEDEQGHDIGLEPDSSGAAQPQDQLMRPPSSPFSVPQLFSPLPIGTPQSDLSRTGSAS